MAPEQASGERVDATAEVYALGELASEMLALEPPHHGATRFEILTNVRSRPVKPIRRIDRDLPP